METIKKIAIGSVVTAVLCTGCGVVVWTIYAFQWLIHPFVVLVVIGFIVVSYIIGDGILKEDYKWKHLKK